MLNFGELLKDIRIEQSLSQRDVVDIISKNNYKLIGIDVVSLSRWENGVTLPSHRRQVDIMNALNIDFYQSVCSHPQLVNEAFDAQKLLKNFVWENHTILENDQLRCIVKKRDDENGGTIIHKTYLDLDEIPLGQLTYAIIDQEAFWFNMRKVPTDQVSVIGNDYLIIKSIFSTSHQVLQQIVGSFITELLSGQVKAIGYASNNSQSQIVRFLKSLGFKSHERGEQFNSTLLSYYDALYNKDLFYCSVNWKLGHGHDR
jgi:transcriptional regulator with XRE-family HTH domain